VIELKQDFFLIVRNLIEIIRYLFLIYIAMKRMRCFQCGNSLPINDKKLHEKYHQYDIAKLHAHFYPTCEWIKEILGSKYIAQVIFDRTSSSNFYFRVCFGSILFIR
jgi:hypothetical protein